MTNLKSTFVADTKKEVTTQENMDLKEKVKQLNE
jgi:hypothetical protein